MLDELSGWRFWSLNESFVLLNLFLRHCHDKAAIGSISRAVLDVAVEFSTIPAVHDVRALNTQSQSTRNS
jgi:hypothetical protein